jgi:putative SOS response-associated peptidase YedK
MCGRFVLGSSWDKIAEEFVLNEINQIHSATGDIHPGQVAACIIHTGTNNDIVNLHWGFVLQRAVQKSAIKLLINARAETVAEKPTFRDAFQKRRCLIIADGFYEWTKDKKPYYFYLQNKNLFGLAGIYDPAIASGDTESSFVIITTGPNELIGPLHDRMPVIIPVDKRSLWLDGGKFDLKQLQSLLVPYPASEMAARPEELTARRI